MKNFNKFIITAAIVLGVGFSATPSRDSNPSFDKIHNCIIIDKDDLIKPLKYEKPVPSMDSISYDIEKCVTKIEQKGYSKSHIQVVENYDDKDNLVIHFIGK